MKKRKNKLEAERITDEEILSRAKIMENEFFGVQQVIANIAPVLNCDICATVYRGKILSWSIYNDGESMPVRFTSYQEAIDYLETCEC